jgi:hypothetical protein
MGMGGTVAGITSGAISGTMPTNFASPADAPPESPAPTASPETPASTASPETPASTPDDDMSAFRQKIEKLKALKDAGLLSDEEFEQERKKLRDTI